MDEGVMGRKEYCKKKLDYVNTQAQKWEHTLSFSQVLTAPFDVFVVTLPVNPVPRMPRIENDIKLDFKDVLLRPKRSTLKSRSEVGLGWKKKYQSLFTFFSLVIEFKPFSYKPVSVKNRLLHPCDCSNTLCIMGEFQTGEINGLQIRKTGQTN